MDERGENSQPQGISNYIKNVAIVGVRLTTPLP